MRRIPKTPWFVSFLPVLLCLVVPAVLVHAESRGEPLSRNWAGAGALSAVTRLPDGEIPYGKTLVLISSLEGGDLAGKSVDPKAVEAEIDRLVERLRPDLQGRRTPKEVVAALNRFLFVEEGFTYDCVAGNEDNYLLDRVLANRRGNCLGLTSLYLILAERLSLPLHGVYVPSHCFVRYEENGVRINIETGERGAERGDGRYYRDFGLAKERPYLQSLGKKEMIGVYLKSLGAAFSRKGMEDRAIRLYRETSAFYPGLPDVYFNAGVSFHKRGLFDDAMVQYRKALALDPDLHVARDNLAVALAKNGLLAEALVEARKAVAVAPRNPVTRANLAATLCAHGMLEDGIREYRKVLEIDPKNVRALAGLANAHYARGDYHEALVHCDKAVERGCTFDPVMLGTLEKYRALSPASLP